MLGLTFGDLFRELLLFLLPQIQELLVILHRVVLRAELVGVLEGLGHLGLRLLQALLRVEGGERGVDHP